MNDNKHVEKVKAFMKKWYIAISIIALLALICVLFKLIDSFTSGLTPAWINVLVWIGLGLFGLALVLLVLSIPMEKRLNKPVIQKQKPEEIEALKKYASKKK